MGHFGDWNFVEGTVFNKNRRLIDPSMALKSQQINKSYNNDSQYPKSSPLQPLQNQVMPPIASYQQSVTPPLPHQPTAPMSMGMGIATRTMNNQPSLTPQSFAALPNSNSPFKNPVLQSIASEQKTLPTLPPSSTFTAGWNDPPPQKLEQVDDMLPNMNARIEGMTFNDGMSTVPKMENDRKSLPDSYLHLQNTFNGLKDLCLKTSNNSVSFKYFLWKKSTRSKKIFQQT